MKRRTLIVDLDCPFGINHFDLMKCDECVDQELFLEKTAPPYAPNQGQTFEFEWTTIGSSGSSTTDMMWTNVGGASNVGTYRIELGSDTVTDTKTFNITNVSIA